MVHLVVDFWCLQDFQLLEGQPVVQPEVLGPLELVLEQELLLWGLVLPLVQELVQVLELVLLLQGLVLLLVQVVVLEQLVLEEQHVL